VGGGGAQRDRQNIRKAMALSEDWTRRRLRPFSTRKEHDEQLSSFCGKTGYPHGRPGYVVDHIIPLECGGADSPSNMQWQTIAEANAKDRTEGNCRR